MQKLILLANTSITSNEVEVFKGELEKKINESINIIVDFSQTKLICSSGIGVLISALKSVKQKGGNIELVIPASNNEISQIFNITRLNKVFNIFTSVDECK